MKAHERFLRYIKYDTQSSDTSGKSPSTEKQFELANTLVDELISLGCEGVMCDDKCYVYAKLPATDGYEDSARIGFIAHMDTSPDFSDSGVDPAIIENYDGGEIKLGNSGRVLSPAMFPHLKNLTGRSLIVTDGTTLLGADDKAGIAEIMTLIENIKEKNIPHGQLSFAFTPDEEIGAGADYFDVDGFGADFAYTVDGGEEGSLEYENFNAAGAVFNITGVNVHPGSAKDVMTNAALVAAEIASMLPENEIPACTEGYEGFYHLTDMKGDCESATLQYIVRDHDAKKFEKKIEFLKDVEAKMKKKYGDDKVQLTVKEQYRNMLEKVIPHMHLIDNAKRAAELAGVSAKVEPIRGGTDGARLSFMGLPCPNLGTGGYAFHGPFEHITTEGMDTACLILENIVKLYSNFKKEG